MAGDKKLESIAENGCGDNSFVNNFSSIALAPYNIGKFHRAVCNSESERDLSGQLGAIVGGALAIPVLMIQSYIAYEFANHELPEIPIAVIGATNLYGVLCRYLK